MSVIATTFTAPASAHAGTVVLLTARAAANRVRRALAIRRTRRALHALGDHLLADIGLDRSDIDRIVPEGFGHAGSSSGRHPF